MPSIISIPNRFFNRWFSFPPKTMYLYRSYDYDGRINLQMIDPDDPYVYLTISNAYSTSDFRSHDVFVPDKHICKSINCESILDWLADQGLVEIIGFVPDGPDGLISPLVRVIDESRIYSQDVVFVHAEARERQHAEQASQVA